MTARELISKTFKLLGTHAAGETPSADEINDGLSTLNQMLAVWSNENLAVYQKVREEFTLTPSTAAYTWGTSGTFNSSRPIQVIDARLELQGSDPQEIPIKILTTKEYAELSSKEMSSTMPQAVYFDGAHPLLGVTFWPVPSAAEKAVFYSLKPFSTLTLATELSYPPGYEKAIRFNLAIDLAPEYGVQLDAIVMQQAMESKSEIKRKNIQARTMKTDLPINTGKNAFDWRLGE
jgi:hypothetical protein